MTAEAPGLFTPLTLRGVALTNRIAAAPMWQYAGEKGFSTDWHVVQLGRLAAGGAGLVFQEGTVVERRGCGTVGDLGLWDDRFIEPLRRLVNVMVSCGAVPGVQLMHAGRKARQPRPWEGVGELQRPEGVDDWDTWDVIAPSAIAQGPGYTIPRAMERRDIQDLKDAWVSAARRAHAAGYQVLEVHGAHGYLLHQFLSSAANQRTDEYGGSLANRCRLLLEVVEGIRSVWPAEKPLFVRLSCVDEQGWTLNDSLALAQQLRALGVDVIDCSSGGIGVTSALAMHRSLHPGYQVPYAHALRSQVGVATMAVGLIVQAKHAQQIVSTGAADLVALARELLYNPNWPMDAARKLGVDPRFERAPQRVGFWLNKRAVSVPGLVYSTSDESGPASG
jgi:2,4-dienoyl-CoA reductase-like NADH-dependent reductase (Old Yellow Enzyme family)